MKRGAKLLRQMNQWLGRFSFGGLLVGTLLFCLSLLPSLLPRPWFFQGVISGISLAIGYGIGTALSSVLRWLSEYEPPKKFKHVAWWVLTIAAPFTAALYLYLGRGWQNSVRHLVGQPPLNSRHSLFTLGTALVLAVILVDFARSIRLLGRFLQKQLDRILPRRITNALVGVLIGVLLIWIYSGVFVHFFVTQAEHAYSQHNHATAKGVTQPSTPLRSGSPASLIAWKTLGYEGRNFVASGPTTTQLEQFSGRPAMEPIRVYAGYESAKTDEARAQLAVRELIRTGAFNRKILLIATPTGSGWLEPQAMDSLEYMWNGDTAIVAQQYSYLPSWISFLVNKSDATNSGRTLFDAVYGAWVKLPADHRPKLYAYGLSLGSYGAQAAYSGINGLRNTLDGALFVGTPNDTQLWRTVTDDRDKGSPEWQPVYQNGTAVRFAATSHDITANQSNWQLPRVLYVQHGSDPIVWFNFNLSFHKPAWLSEPRAPDVSPSVHWYPVVTFWQIAIDQLSGTKVPAGHGHNYANTAAASWAAITQPPDWTSTDTARLQKLINTYPGE